MGLLPYDEMRGYYPTCIMRVRATRPEEAMILALFWINTISVGSNISAQWSNRLPRTFDRYL